MPTEVEIRKFSPDLDPVLDHTLAVAKSITASEVIITPPTVAAGGYDCRYMLLTSLSVDCYFRTDDVDASVPTDEISGGVAAYLPAGQPHGVNVRPGIPVRVISSGGATIVTAIPGKPRA